MPKRAFRFKFTEDQSKRIQSYYAEFEKKVAEHDPHHEGRNSKITAWKQNKAAALLGEQLFQNLDPAETQEAWQSAIVRIYTNHFNSSIKKGKPAAAKKAAGTNNRELVLFTGKITPRQLFIAERHEEITTLYKSISREKGIAGGPAKSEATSQLWAQEDHAFWEEKAQEFLTDVDVNRSEFTDTIQAKLQDMLNTGSLGSCILSLSYSFRDLEDNGIVSGVIHETTHLPVTTGDGDEFDPGEGYMKDWIDYARRKLPRKTLNLVTTMTCNSDGLPLFPIFNLKTHSYADASQVLEDYFLAVWEYTQEGSIRIPWDNIFDKPHLYYDIMDHGLPCRLTSPMDMGAIEITQLVVHLNKNAIKYPFAFFTKARVDSNLALAKRFEDASPPPPREQSHDNEVTPPSSPLVKAFQADANDDASPPPSANSHTITNDDDATPASLRHVSPARSPTPASLPVSPARSPSPASLLLTKPVEDGNAHVSAGQSPTPPSLPFLKAVNEDDDAHVSPARPPSPEPSTAHAHVSPARPPSPEPSTAHRPVRDAASTLAVIARLLPGTNLTSETLLAAVTAMVANSGSRTVPPHIEAPLASISASASTSTDNLALLASVTAMVANSGSGTVSPHIEPPPALAVHPAPMEDTSVASSNIEEVGKKRKRGRPAKIKQDVISASASTSTDNLASKPASSTRRTGRERKPVAKNPCLLLIPLPHLQRRSSLGIHMSLWNLICDDKLPFKQTSV
ncbi:hypothetical protein BJ912DRAFT_930363 [Pholiota molesta]|nr:hypothetical protein BJ912DRAFT_930363 [Pholiota molesta]